MRHKGIRIIAGIAWVIGAMAVWDIIINVFHYIAFTCLTSQAQMNRLERINTAGEWTALAGGFVIPIVFTLLAMRSKLPGTGQCPRGRRGFPVEPSRPSERR